jgi:hypothetical protein
MDAGSRDAFARGLAAALALLVAGLGIATNLATDLRHSWIAWAVVAALAVAVAGVTYLSQGGRASDDHRVRRLVDEAAFAMAAREWHGNRNDSDWVLAQLQRFLRDPVLMPKRKAKRAARKAEHDAEATDTGDAMRGFAKVRAAIDAVQPLLPEEDEYLHALHRAPREARLAALQAGYMHYTAEREDRWAWYYLLLMKDLDEHNVLAVLAERVQQMREVRASPPPHTDAAIAYPATLGLAEEILGDGYLGWWVRNIDRDPTTVEHRSDFIERSAHDSPGSDEPN